MGMMRRLIAVGVGLAAGAAAATVLKKLNDPILDEDEVAVRAGHHCAQPLLTHLGVRSSARASLAFYNDEDDVERLIRSLNAVRGKMGLG